MRRPRTRGSSRQPKETLERYEQGSESPLKKPLIARIALHGLILEYRPVPGLIPFTPNAVLTDIVRRVERDELKPNPRHITELRLN